MPGNGAYIRAYVRVAARDLNLRQQHGTIDYGPARSIADNAAYGPVRHTGIMVHLRDRNTIFNRPRALSAYRAHIPVAEHIDSRIEITDGAVLYHAEIHAGNSAYPRHIAVDIDIRPYKVHVVYHAAGAVDAHNRTDEHPRSLMPYGRADGDVTERDIFDCAVIFLKPAVAFVACKRLRRDFDGKSAERMSAAVENAVEFRWYSPAERTYIQVLC